VGEEEEFLAALRPSTRASYRSALEAFRSFYGRPVEEFMDEVEEDMSRGRGERRRVARAVMNEFISWLDGRGYKPQSVRLYVAAVQSLLRYYEIPFSTRYVRMPPNIPSSRRFPWTLEKVGEFVGGIGDPVTRAIAAVIFQSGISLGDLLSLRYGDIAEEYEAGVEPLCLDLVRRKTRNPYMTFVGRWGCGLLRGAIGRLGPDDPLFDVSLRTVDHRFRIEAKRWLGEVGEFNPCSPHSLRHAFRTILGDAGMPVDEIRFFMGHRLPEQERTYMSRSREGWRALYSRYEKFLTPGGNV
jgi:integrase